METSLYQLFKIYFFNYVPLSKDATHIYIGLIVFFVVGIFVVKNFSSVKPVLFVLGFALLMEIVDLRDDYSAFGYFRWGASFHDIVNTCFWPLVIFLLFRFGLLESRNN